MFYFVNKVAPRHTSAILTLLEGLIEMISTGRTLCVVKTKQSHVYCFWAIVAYVCLLFTNVTYMVESVKI